MMGVVRARGRTPTCGRTSSRYLRMHSKRIPELDGIRGFAALTVVIAHYFGEAPHGFRALTAGWLGVDLFFVLSGFLIGSIILNQQDSPGFFRTFYLKRCARIVPVYALVCIATLIACKITAGHIWSDQPFSQSVYAVFASNLVMSAGNTAGDVWLRPTWTLDVEEQFYLILPVLIWMVPRQFLAPLLAALWASATVLRAALFAAHPAAALVLLPCRMDFLLAGVILALSYNSIRLFRHTLALRLGALAAALMLLLLHIALGATAFVVFGGAIASAGIASFLGAVLCGAPEGMRYRSPVLRYFGQISYCLYLVHQPVAGLLHGLVLGRPPDIANLQGWSVSIAALAISIAIATASWKWFEQPILSAVQNHRFKSFSASARVS